MAGKFVTILNPGYSTLYTRDLAYAPNTTVGEATALNPFDPDSDHPLFEGEWLSVDNTGKLTRLASATGAVPVAGGATEITYINDAQNVPGTRPCFMYFQERGRYDAQLTRKAHCITGPAGFEFRTKMIDSTDADEGQPVFAVLCEDSSGRRVSALVPANNTQLAAAASGLQVMSVGIITVAHGTNDSTVLYQPSFYTFA